MAFSTTGELCPGDISLIGAQRSQLTSPCAMTAPGRSWNQHPNSLRAPSEDMEYSPCDTGAAACPPLPPMTHGAEANCPGACNITAEEPQAWGTLILLRGLTLAALCPGGDVVSEMRDKKQACHWRPGATVSPHQSVHVPRALEKASTSELWGSRREQPPTTESAFLA